MFRRWFWGGAGVLRLLAGISYPRGFSFPQGSLHEFVSQARIRLLSPVHGSTYNEHALVPVQVDIELESTEDWALDSDERLWFRVEVDRQSTAPLVISRNATTRATAALVSSYSRKRGLSPQNSHYLLTRVEEALIQLRCPLPSSCDDGRGVQRRVCVSIDGQPEVCSKVDKWQALTVRAPQGFHGVSAWLIGFPGRDVLHRSVANFTLQPSCEANAIDVLCPRHGQHLATTAVVIRAVVRLPAVVEAAPTLCIRLESSEGRLVHSGCGHGAQFTEIVRGLLPGRYALTSYSTDGEVRLCSRTLTFQVSDDAVDSGTTTEGNMPSLVFVTGASQLYFDEQRLQNLIGSIHFWEPDTSILFYDLGLSEVALAEVQQWANVEVRRLDLSGFPPHVADPQQYAFKPLVILDALDSLHRGEADRIFWIDANAELRRPLDEVRRYMQADGHFFTTQPYDFPTAQFHHPDAVRGLGCLAPDLSRQHCSTAFIGLVAGSWAHREVMVPAAECAVVQSCINPPGSHRGNHRQEQTVVNSIFCRLNATEPCRQDKRWRMTSDFENDEEHVQPTLDETDWNEMVFYTRRNFPVKPYVRHLRMKTPPRAGVY